MCIIIIYTWPACVINFPSRSLRSILISLLHCQVVSRCHFINSILHLLVLYYTPISIIILLRSLVPTAVQQTRVTDREATKSSVRMCMKSCDILRNDASIIYRCARRAIVINAVMYVGLYLITDGHWAKQTPVYSPGMTMASHTWYTVTDCEDMYGRALC